MIDILMELKSENTKLYSQLMEQDKMLSKLQIKKESDNATKIVNSNERIAVLIAQMATANAKSSDEAIEILNDICKELENRNNSNSNNDYSHLRVMSKAE